MQIIKHVMLLAVSLVFLSGCNYENEEEVKKYIKDKHGIDIVVKNWGGIHEGNMGHTYHIVEVKDNKHIQFRVEVNGFFHSTIKGDEYEYGKNAYEEYKKFKPTLKEIEKLGYSELDEENAIQYVVDSGGTIETPTNELLLTLKSSNKIDYSQFESKELDRLFALSQLIQENNKKITQLEIRDNKGDYTGLSFKDVQESTTKEELLLTMKNASKDYWTYLIQTQVEDKVKGIQNESFKFKEIVCSYTENGDCPAYNVTLDFNKGMLRYKNNPNLIEDLTKVVTLVKEELHNKKFTIYFTSKGSKSMYEGWIESKDMKESETTEEFLKKYFHVE
ncbi:hypothetical protein [Bacillus bingmayongensis]|uniref:hypothetical protein n=1 Tax=Bacillus bingmayongensis TaxID=1150157 RepID=UPI0002E48F1E|nr:hypothetical protein [Bacillus bingmayongensis]MBY0597784.1 hypothetical protein [Bacillus bingmayongensis]